MGNSDRMERILAYVRSGSVFPHGYLSHPANAKVRNAVYRVLQEIPADVFNKVEREISFFFDASRPTAGGCLFTTPTVVIFERSLKRYSEVALAGLIGHELAHHDLPADASEDEVDQRVISWGLLHEIRALHREGGR